MTRPCCAPSLTGPHKKVFSMKKAIKSFGITLMSVILLFCGIVPVFSQELLATFASGGQFLDHKGYREDYRSVEDRDTVAKGGTFGVNMLFVGRSGFTVSAGTDVIFLPGGNGGVNIDPVLGLGYVYYRGIYFGGILNWVPKPYIQYNRDGSYDSWWHQDVFVVPTVLAGFDFGGFVLEGRLSYMRGIMSSVNGFKFSLGAGVNLGGGRGW